MGEFLYVSLRKDNKILGFPLEGGIPGEAAVFAVSGGPAPMILLPVESRPLFEPLPVKIVRFVDKAVIWV
jgi:hypothetical protein